MILPQSFYLDENVVEVAKALLGKVLVTQFNGKKTSGIITETEAYAGITDKASHAYNNKRTNRTETMYRAGGVSYIYICYGIHHLFNVVTNKVDVPHAVLIRACEPLEGIDEMMKRKNMTKFKTTITTGPGAMSKALGLHIAQTGFSLLSDIIYIENKNIIIQHQDIISTTRIGVGYAKEDAMLPYRFYIKGSKFITKK